MIIIAIGLVLLASLFIAATLRPPSKPAALLAICLLGQANIVLSSYIANTFRALNQPLVIIGLHLIVALLAGILWRRSEKPSLLGPFEDWKDELRLKKITAFIKNWPDLTILGIGVIAAFALAAILIIVVPPNNNDSMSAHLARVGYWLQHGSFFPWPTARVIQVYYPVNAQLQMLWTVLFTRADKLVGFVQWAAALASGIGVFGMARLLGWKRAQSAFAALVFLTFPLMLLQSTTTQNDLVTTGLYVLAVYFLLLGIQKKQRSMLILSAISLGLGLGSKQIFYFLLPGLGILVLLVWKRYGKQAFGNLAFWAACCVTAYAVFAAYINVINWQTFGGFFGPAEAVEQSTGSSGSDAANNLLYNVPRLLYQALDTSGLPDPLDGYAHKVKARIAAWFFDAIGLPIEGNQYAFGKHVFSLATKNENQEDDAWYGPLCALLLFPAMIYQLIKGIRTKEWMRVGLVLNGVIFLLCVVGLRPGWGWDPYQGRYFAAVIAINAPLMADWVSAHNRRRLFRWLAVSLALTVTVVTMSYNPAKPLAGEATKRVNIWSADRLTLQTLQNHRYQDMIVMINDAVPADATLGIYHQGYMWEYPLFGEHFTRRLIPIYPLEKASQADFLRANDIRHVLVQIWGEEPSLPEGFVLVSQLAEWKFYVWEK